MKYGVREIADVVLRAKSKQKIGKRTFYRNDPVIYFDSLTTSSLEGAATTNYANGGRGNARLMAWEGERTLTFNMTDALISPESFMILSGAGLIDASNKTEWSEEDTEHVIYVHTTSQVQASDSNTIILPKVACWSHSGEIGAMDTSYYHDGADIFVMVLDAGEIVGEPCIPAEQGVSHGHYATADDVAAGKATKIGDFVGGVDANGKLQCTKVLCTNHGRGIAKGAVVLVDYYVKRIDGVKQIEITPDKFGGYFYLEGSTLFKRESDGKDLPAEIVIPKVKIQSNFTFTMASNGDPSTFDFVMDAFPDYTKFDGTKKVLAIMQIVESDSDEEANEDFSRRGHCNTKEEAEELVPKADSADFDHWKTYGAENHFATMSANGDYPNTHYFDGAPNAGRDPEANRLRTFELSLDPDSASATFTVDGKAATSAFVGKTVTIVTDASDPTITVNGEVISGNTFTMTNKNAVVKVTAG